MKNVKKIIGFGTAGVVALGLGAWAFTHQSAAAGETIVIGSKNFTENIVLGEIYAQSLEGAGFTVERKLNLGGTFVAQNALQEGEIDLYPEYTGTGLIDILKKEPSSDKEAVYQTVKTNYEKKWNLTWLESTQGNDSQGLVVTKDAAEKYDLKTFSDLAEHAKDLRFAATPEFNGRKDGLPGLQEAYGGFEFKANEVVDNGVRYQALENDQADATVAFTTDAQLTNEDLVLLEDDQQFYPPYYVAPVVSEELVKQDPKIEEVLNEVSEKITTQTLQDLNAKVDLDHEKAEQVAKEFLAEN
ncbi:MAG: glycine betaine ABC transporter substrate-binding protein [Enterococcus sp.]